MRNSHFFAHSSGIKRITKCTPSLHQQDGSRKGIIVYDWDLPRRDVCSVEKVSYWPAVKKTRVISGSRPGDK
jgi:hypothetical protein